MISEEQLRDSLRKVKKRIKNTDQPGEMNELLIAKATILDALAGN